MARLLWAGMLLASLLIIPLPAQDFGFGFDGEDELLSEGGAPAGGLAIGGEVSAAMTGYVKDFSGDLNQAKLGNIFSGRLNFSASFSGAEGVVNLKLRPAADPVSIDEAYVRVYFGNFDLEAGLRKLAWGKADSLGPLDVINPLDSSEIYPEMADNSDLMGLKIARPLVHGSLRFGRFSKLEGVFVPNFEPHRFAETGRWAAGGMGMLASATPPDTAGLKYAQGGLRFTTTLGSSDIGAQYYYGRLMRPAARIRLTPTLGAELLYNPYHQIGFDYAQVILGFNLRAEFAANITEDISGDDGSVYNPALAWSLGFDRDLFLGINLNVQADQTLRLMDGSLGSADFMSGSFDIEAGTDPTATRIRAVLSRKFLREELEFRAAAVCGVEDRDFLILPALIWTRGDVKISASGGFFGGDKAGQLGQYHNNNFVKLGLTYSF